MVPLLCLLFSSAFASLPSVHVAPEDGLDAALLQDVLLSVSSFAAVHRLPKDASCPVRPRGNALIAVSSKDCSRLLSPSSQVLLIKHLSNATQYRVYGGQWTPLTAGTDTVIGTFVAGLPMEEERAVIHDEEEKKPPVVDGIRMSVALFVLCCMILVALAAASFLLVIRRFVVRKNQKKEAPLEEGKKERPKETPTTTSKSQKKASGPVKVHAAPPASPAPDHGATPQPSAVKPTKSSSSSTARVPERLLHEKIEEPVTADEFTKYMAEAAAFISDTLRNPTNWPVTPSIRPHDIFLALPDSPPFYPETFEAVMGDYKSIIYNGLVKWQHPRFLAFFTCGKSYPDMLAEAIISGLGSIGFSWACNPAVQELELTVTNWMGRALGLPESFLYQGDRSADSPGGGYVADTASQAIFNTVMVARNQFIETEMRRLSAKNGQANELNPLSKYSLRNEICGRLAHSSYEKACNMALVRCRGITTRAENEWGMTRADVEAAIEKDLSLGLLPFYLQIAIGTTSTATSDNLKELVPLGKKYNMWIHVDGAYAGSAWVEPKYRNVTLGLDLADSLNVNLHKFFLTSCPVTMFWTRHQALYKEGLAVVPEAITARAAKDGMMDGREWNVQLGRRFKALKIWFLLRMYGINGMRAYVNRMIDMTRYLESKLLPHPNLRKFCKEQFGVFCVQYWEEGMNEQQVNTYTNKLCEFLNESHQLFFTHSAVQGHDIIRVTVTYERSTTQTIDDTIDVFRKLIDEFKQLKDEPDLLECSRFTKIKRKRGASVFLPHDVDHGVVGSPAVTAPNTLSPSSSTGSLSTLPREAEKEAVVPSPDASSTVIGAKHQIFKPVPVGPPKPFVPPTATPVPAKEEVPSAVTSPVEKTLAPSPLDRSAP